MKTLTVGYFYTVKNRLTFFPVDYEGNQSFATLKLTFWDIDFKLFFEKQNSERT